MKKILVMAILSLSLMVCLTSPAWAGGLDDLKAGMAAYDEKERIGLFSKAIASGELSREDLAKAYYSRGSTWLGLVSTEFDVVTVTTKSGIPIDCEGNAIADFTNAIEINPRYADAYRSRGWAWSDKREYDKAIADYTKVIEINPKDAEAYDYRGRVWERKGDYDKAKADFAQADDLKYGYSRDIADYTKAIKINPKDADAYYHRGCIWGKKGDYDKAIADLTKAIELDPKNAKAAYYERSQAGYAKYEHDLKIGDTTKAISAYAKAYADSVKAKELGY